MDDDGSKNDNPFDISWDINRCVKFVSQIS